MNNKDLIQISVIIPTYNRGRLIQRAIDSLLCQTVLPDEIIIIDDGSFDETKEVVYNYIHKNPFIRYIKSDINAGAQSARNIGIKEARGNYILLMDSDDALDKSYFEKAKDFILHDPSVDVLTNFTKIINEVNNTEESFHWITKGNILKDILSGKAYVAYNAALIKKKKLIEIGELDEKCPSYQEWDTHIRLAGICKYDYIQEHLSIYYKHREERISNQPSREVAGKYYILHKHKDIWLKEAGKEIYLKQLLTNYKIALQHGEQQYLSKIRKDIYSLDPVFFLKQRYNKIKSTVIHCLAYYKNMAIKKLL